MPTYELGEKRSTALCGTRSGNHKHRKDGTVVCEPCREAHRKYENERRKKNPERTREQNRRWRNENKEKARTANNKLNASRTRFLRDYKLSKGCMDCGYNEYPEVLEFDHLRDKMFQLGSGSRNAWHKVLEEIDKCEVVCANCHRVRTVLRRDGKETQNAPQL